VSLDADLWTVLTKTRSNASLFAVFPFDVTTENPDLKGSVTLKPGDLCKVFFEPSTEVGSAIVRLEATDSFGDPTDGTSHRTRLDEDGRSRISVVPGLGYEVFSTCYRREGDLAPGHETHGVRIKHTMQWDLDPSAIFEIQSCAPGCQPRAADLDQIFPSDGASPSLWVSDVGESAKPVVQDDVAHAWPVSSHPKYLEPLG
jgi:hypothetical protein